MTISLYSAVVPSCRQIVGAVAGLVDTAEAFCRERGLEPAEIVGARLAPDMLPFGYQVKSVKEHSLGAIEGVRRGVFSPALDPWPDSFEGLRAVLANAAEALAALDPEEVNAFVGRDMRFQFGERGMDFTAEDFLLSFSQPNFYFHAATAYDILRMKGVSIGKREFLGRPRLKA